MQKKFLTLALLLAAATAATAQTGNVTMDGGWSTANSRYEYSGTFSQPAYDVEVTTELYYKLDATQTLAENVTAYGSKTDFFLDRTLTAGVWNTFASPFAIAAEQMEAYFGTGYKVRYLESTEIEGTTLYLNFDDATSIVAGKPYIVKPATNVDFSANGKEFAGVDLNAASATPDETTYVNFVPTLGKTNVTEEPENVLMMTIEGKLAHPSATGDMKGFRGYFVLHEASAGARAYVINFGDGETTDIIAVEGSRFTVNDEPSTIYDLQGRKVENATKKGIYIQNGKKVVIK